MIYSFLLSSCSSNSDQGYQVKIVKQIKSLTGEIDQIHDISTLKKKHNKLKKKFIELSKVLIDYRTFIEKNPEVEPTLIKELERQAKALKEAITALLELEGAHDLIIEVQQEAYNKLLHFEQGLSNEKINLYKQNQPLTGYQRSQS